ncbi:caspase family protein (plasmid) [Streptomyces sp. NBC_01369]|uniref:caspase family protein n=1 Tax=Streptomyces sp. NBC_01369 TaxID=2903842 RepID=UPI002F914FAC
MSPNSRDALLISTGQYDDVRLQALRSPGPDATELASILGDSELCGFTVSTVIDCGKMRVSIEIERFFRDRSRDDMLLLHLSCHGIKDEEGRLFFAVRDTDKDILASTAVSAEFLRDQMDHCRARTIVLFLDCCYSGAFIDGVRGDTDTHVTERFGYRGHKQVHGRAVLTATNRIEYAWEGNHSTSLEPVPSYFTGTIIRGLRTGDADLDKDGLITVDNLYDYIYEELHSIQAKQRPQKSVNTESNVVIARVKKSRYPQINSGSEPVNTYLPDIAPGERLPFYSTDFTYPSGGWAEGAGGSTFTSRCGNFEGNYRLNITGEDHPAYKFARAPLPGHAPSGALISIVSDAWTNSTSGQLGVYCHGSFANSYIFLVCTDGHGVEICREFGPDGERMKPIAGNLLAHGFKKGNSNLLQAACEQTRDRGVYLRLWVNGKLAIETYDHDHPIPDGSAGLIARIKDGGADSRLEAKFENFTVERI